MSLISVKISGVRIRHVVVPDGRIATEALIEEEDLAALKAKAPGLLAWSQDMPVKDMPAEWRNPDGSPRHCFAGYESTIPGLVAIDEPKPVEEPVEEEP